MVIRDLTLRSAASFGSFHLIRLLFDEYMYFLVEHKVAHERNETTVAIMGEVSHFYYDMLNFPVKTRAMLSSLRPTNCFILPL